MFIICDTFCVNVFSYISILYNVLMSNVSDSLFVEELCRRGRIRLCRFVGHVLAVSAVAT